MIGRYRPRRPAPPGPPDADAGDDPAAVGGWPPTAVEPPPRPPAPTAAPAPPDLGRPDPEDDASPVRPARRRREPESTVLAALAHKWPVVVLVAAALALLGAIVGNDIPPRYTSEAVLNVGTPQVTSQAVPGYVTAAQSLASYYSRIATTRTVLEPAAREIGVSPAVARTALDVSPVASSTLVSVRASGGSPQAVRSLAAAEARFLQRAVRRTQSSPTSSEALERVYRRASLRTIRAQQEVDRLQRLRLRDADSVSLARIASARTTSDVLGVRQQALAGQLSTALTASDAAAQLVLLTPAGVPTDDRSETTQEALFIGLAAGLVLGIALAVVADVRRRRRALGGLG